MKLKFLKQKPVILLAAAAVLLGASAVGSAQAALTYYSETYTAQVTVSNIGVSLLENGKAVSHRDYIENDKWDENTGVLLENMLEKDEKVALGKTYKEELSVKNSGTIDTYVRVILTKSWKDADGVKNPELSPKLIDLNLITGGSWIVDEDASTAERTVLYYKDILTAGETSPLFADTLRIDPSIGTKVTETVVTDDGTYKTITYVHTYDGYTFNIEAEVDSVQTHNAAAAIKSAWGVDVNIAADKSLSLQ